MTKQKSLLLLIPACPGPGNKKRWNSVWPDDLERQIWNKYWNVFTPGPLVLATIARTKGFHVEVIDEEFQRIDKKRKYDIVAMYSVTPNILRCFELSSYYRSSGAHVVVGGVHATLCPEEVADHVDTVLIGEAEKIWEEFLDDYQKKSPCKRYEQEPGSISIQDSPIPSFDLLPKSNKLMIPIQSARGCPHGCRFCNVRNLYGEGYRAKSIKQMIDELNMSTLLFPHTPVYFTDDNFFVDKRRARALLAVLKEYNLSWYANTDVSFGTDTDLIKMSYESGCRNVLIGFESINPAILKDIDCDSFKSYHRRTYETAIQNIQREGIGVVGSFIVGLDGETETTYDELFQFIQTTGLYGVNITMNTPYPGTQLFKQMNEQNRILTYDWNQYTIFQPVFQPLDGSLEDLQNRYLTFLQKVYSDEAQKQRLDVLQRLIRKKRGFRKDCNEKY